MISPVFRSAALLVHLAGLWVEICRACRHFGFCCDFNPICDVVCQHFSSASLELLFQLHALSASFSNEILLSWSFSPFVLCSFPDSFVSSLISPSCMSFLPQSLLFFWVRARQIAQENLGKEHRFFLCHMLCQLPVGNGTISCDPLFEPHPQASVHSSPPHRVSYDL